VTGKGGFLRLEANCKIDGRSSVNMAGEGRFLGLEANGDINRWGQPDVTGEGFVFSLEVLRKIERFVVRGCRGGGRKGIVFTFSGHRGDTAGIKIDKPKAVFAPFTPIIIILDLEFSSKDNLDKAIAKFSSAVNLENVA
jgi:hypothetical protein